MTFISYAQNFEDVMLWRALKHVENGFYIDVGANDPTIDSVTLAFYERGWRGINIEPMQQYYELLRTHRPEDVNLQVAAGDTVGELVFYDMPDTGLSTADERVAREHMAAGRTVVEQRMRVTTLNDICNVHAPGTIHFLKIDVEGFEKAVLLGMDFRRWRPWILVIEATRPQSNMTVHDEWEGLILGAGYRFVYFDGLNHYYVAEEQPDLLAAFRAPPNVFDEFILRSGHAYSYPLTEFQERTAQAEERAHWAHVELQSSQAETRAANQRTQEANQRTRDAEARIREWEAINQQEQRRTQQEHERALAAEAQAHRLHEALTAVYHSTSWRVSAPVRLLGRWAIKGKAMTRRTVSGLRSSPKRAVAGSLRVTAPWLKRIPFMTKVVSRLSRKFPGLFARLSTSIKPPAATPHAETTHAVLLTATQDSTSSGYFKTMLLRELRQRQNKKYEPS